MSEILSEADIVKHRNCAVFVNPPEAVLVLIDSHEALRARVRELEQALSAFRSGPEHTLGDGMTWEPQ